MFAKLFKHEFLATWRLLATVVGLIWLVSLTLMLPAWFNLSVIGPVGLVLAVIGFCVGGAVPPVLLAVTYWRSMYSGRGYFTHSLPVRGRVIFGAKLLYANLVSLVAMVIGLGLAIILPGLTADRLGLVNLGEAWRAITDAVSPGRLWVLFALALVITVAEYVLVLSAISLGTRGALGRLGLGGPVISLAVAYTAIQILTVIAMFAIPVAIRLTGPEVGRLTIAWMGLSIFSPTPELVGVGWLAMPVVLAVVAAPLAVRSIERHTCLA